MENSKLLERQLDTQGLGYARSDGGNGAHDTEDGGDNSGNAQVGRLAVGRAQLLIEGAGFLGLFSLGL